VRVLKCCPREAPGVSRRQLEATHSTRQATHSASGGQVVSVASVAVARQLSASDARVGNRFLHDWLHHEHSALHTHLKVRVSGGCIPEGQVPPTTTLRGMRCRALPVR
jgi:hypothetical protein